jgi:RHS repeat-associated protein
VDFVFTGDAVSFIYNMNNDEGTVRLTLDPGPSQIVLADIVQTLSGPGTTYQHQRTLTGFAAGAHVLRISYLNGAPGSENNRTNFDAVRAYSAGKQHVYDDDNRLKQSTEGANTTNYQYDKNGSMTKKTLSTDNTVYTYDGARRLKDVSLNGTSQASFTYDGNGARTTKSTSSGTTTYVNDTRALTQVLQETKGATMLTYVPGVLQHDSSLTGNAQWSYFHQDAQNNRALTDNTTSVSKRWEYEPFGSIRTQTGTGASDFQYAGEQRDSETGLINLRARYYDPAIGRFVSRDLMSGTAGFPQSYNRYAYVLNNPVRKVDPSGYSSDEGKDKPTEAEKDQTRSTTEAQAARAAARDEALNVANNQRFQTESGQNLRNDEERVEYIRNRFGINIVHYSREQLEQDPSLQNFTTEQLDAMISTLNSMAATMEDPQAGVATNLKRLLGTDTYDVSIERMNDELTWNMVGKTYPISGTKSIKVDLSDRAFHPSGNGTIDQDWTNFVVAHELGHVADFSHGLRYSRGIRSHGLNQWADAYNREWHTIAGRWGKELYDAPGYNNSVQEWADAFAVAFFRNSVGKVIDMGNQEWNEGWSRGPTHNVDYAEAIMAGFKMKGTDS